MQYRPLGKTGISVSEIGYGAWGIGGGGRRSRRRVRSRAAPGHRGWQTFIDTVRGYGESERICGQVVREHPGNAIFVATKVPPKNGIWPAPAGVDPMDTFPGKHIHSSLDKSLRESGLRLIDVLQFHVWSDEWFGRGDWLETIEALRSEGKIRFFGISINDYQPDNALELIRPGM